MLNLTYKMFLLYQVKLDDLAVKIFKWEAQGWGFKFLGLHHDLQDSLALQA